MSARIRANVLNGRPHLFEKRPRDREAHSGSRILRRVKNLEEPFLLVGFQAGSGISDINLDMAVALLGGDVNRAFVSGRVDGVQ